MLVQIKVKSQKKRLKMNKEEEISNMNLNHTLVSDVQEGG